MAQPFCAFTGGGAKEGEERFIPDKCFLPFRSRIGSCPASNTMYHDSSSQERKSQGENERGKKKAFGIQDTNCSKH